LLLVVSLLYC